MRKLCRRRQPMLIFFFFNYKFSFIPLYWIAGKILKHLQSFTNKTIKFIAKVQFNYQGLLFPGLVFIAIFSKRTGSKKQKFGISYVVVRPQILSTVLNLVDLKSYIVQIRDVHCTIHFTAAQGPFPSRAASFRF